MQRHYYVIHSLLINSMRLTNDNKSSIKLLRQEKGWGTEGICKEFPNKKWSVSSVKDHIDTSTHIAFVFCHCDIMMLGVL